MPDWFQFRQDYNNYLENPSDFKWDDIEKLQHEAQQLGVPFDLQDPGFSAVGISKNLWGGLVQGWTTVPVGDKPRNDIEGIAHSLGHLIGFIGVIPGVGSLTKIGVTGALWGGKQIAKKLVKEGSKKAFAAKALSAAEGRSAWIVKNFPSVPMAVANKATDMLAKTSAATAIRGAVGNDIARQMIRHGTHLGIASATSGIYESFKEEDFMHAVGSVAQMGLQGAMLGGTFAGIGNVPLSRIGVGAMTTTDRALKALAGATVQSLPGAMQDATTPENVYNFLLGGYFGGRAQPVRIEKLNRFFGGKDKAAREGILSDPDFLAADKPFQKDVLDYIELMDAKLPVQSTFKKIFERVYPDSFKATQDQIDVPKGPDWEITQGTGKRKGTVVKKLQGTDAEDGSPLELSVSFTKEGELRFVTIRGKDEGQYARHLKVGELNEKGEPFTVKDDPNWLADQVDSIFIPNKPVPVERVTIGQEVTLQGGKYRGETGEVTKETPNSYYVKLATKDAPIVRVRKEGVTFKEELTGIEKVEEVMSPEMEGRYEQEMSEIHDFDATAMTTLRPAEMLIKKMVGKAELTDEAYLGHLRNLNEMVHKILTAEDKPSWKEVSKSIIDMATEIQKTAGAKEVKFTEEDLGQFRQFYIKNESAISIPRFAFNSLNGKFEEQDMFDGTGKRIDRREPLRLINEIALSEGLVDKPEDAFFIVKRIVIRRKSRSGKEYPVELNISDKLFETKDYKNMITQASEMGYYPYSGKSDSPQLIFMKMNTGDGSAKELIRIRKELRKKVPEFDKLYKELKDQAIKEMDISGEIYDDMFVSNIRWWEAQNNKTISNMIGEEGFLQNVIDFNKRQQPLFSNFNRLTRDTFGMPFNFVITNDYVDSKDPAVKAIRKEWEKRTGKKVKIGDPDLDPFRIEQSDGAAGITSSLLKDMLLDQGLSQTGGFGKPFFNASTKDGLLIGKLAFHGKNEKFSKGLFDKDVDIYIPKSVAKQYGSMKPVDLSYNKDTGEVTFTRNGKKVDVRDYTYQMEPEDVLMSYGIRDVPPGELNKPIRVFKGIQDVLVSHEVFEKYPEIYGEMQRFMEGYADGVPRTNDRLNDFIVKGALNRKELKFLMDNFENIGIKEMNDAFWNNSEAGIAFREAARKKIFKISEPGMEETSFELAKDYENENMGERQSSAMRMIEHGGHTDAGSMNKLTSAYADKALTNYFLKRIISPKVGNSGKAVMREFDPELWTRTDTDGPTREMFFRDDLLFLDEGRRHQKIKGLDKNGNEVDTTIGKMWDLYKETPEGTKLKIDLKEAMRSIVVRSPMDNVSGMADLKFGGFTGEPGFGMLIHPNVMKRLGGADLDIDTGNFYMNVFPKGLHKVSKHFRNSLKEAYKYAEKEYGGMGELKSKFIVSSKLKGKNGPLAMFDPFHRISTANIIQNVATKMRGITTNSKQYTRWLYSMARQQPDGVYTDTMTKDRIKGTTVKFTARDSEVDIVAKSIAAMSVSVDVGKYGGMIGPNKVRATFMDAAFEKIVIEVPGTKNRKPIRRVLENMEDYEQFYEPGGIILWGEGKKAVSIGVNDTVMGKLAATQSKFFSYNWGAGRKWTKDERMVAAQEHPRDDFSHTRYIADKILELDYSDSFYARVSKSTRRYENYIKSINKILRRHPDLLNYLPTNKDGDPFVFKIPLRRSAKKVKGKDGKIKTVYGKPGIMDRIDALSQYYEPDPRKPSYNSAYNIATHRGRSRLVRDPVAWGRFTKRVGKPELEKAAYYKRLGFLQAEIKRINDFISNDLWDIASIKTLNDIGTMFDIPFDVPSESLFKDILRSTKLIKDIHREAYNDASESLDTSPTGTAYDRVMRQIAKEKAKFKFMAEAYNATKPESRKPITEEGLSRFFEAAIMSSIGKGRDTRVHSFQPIFAGKPVVNLFNKNYKQIFDFIGEKPRQKDLRDWFNSSFQAEEAKTIERQLEYIKGVDLSFKEIEGKDVEVPADIAQAGREIASMLETYPMINSPEAFVKMIRHEYGVAELSDINKSELMGLRDLMRSWRDGRGWFRWMSRGRGREIMSKLTRGKWDINEIDGDYIKPAIPSWLKPSETVATDHMRNDLELIDRRMLPVRHFTNKGKMKTVYVDAVEPLSHMGKNVQTTARLHDMSAEWYLRDHKKLEDTLLKIRAMKNSEGKDETDLLVDLAWREREFEGAIKERDQGRASNVLPEEMDKLQNNVETFATRVREKKDEYKRVRGQEYTYKDKIITGEETLGEIKNEMESFFDYAYKTKIQIQDDFPDLLTTKEKGFDNYTLEERIDLNIRKSIKDNLEAMLRPGVIADPKARAFSLGEAKYFWYENELDAWARIEGPKLEKLNFKDVRNLKEIIHEMEVTDQHGVTKVWDLFQPLLDRPGDNYRDVYIRSLLKFARNSHNEVFMNDLKDRQIIERDKNYFVGEKKQANLDAIDNWLKLTNQEKILYDLTDYDILLKVAAVKSYFLQSSDAPFKKGTEYSQYQMDKDFASGKVDPVFYMKEKYRHDRETKYTGVGKREGYMPHMDFDLEVLKKDMDQRMDWVRKSDEIRSSEKARILNDIVNRYKSLETESTLPDFGLNEVEAKFLMGKQISGIDQGAVQLGMLGGNKSTGNMLRRINNWDGHSRDLNIAPRYVEGINRAIASNISSLLAQNNIRDFVKKKPMGKWTGAWEDFMRIYVRDSMGSPTTIPDEMVDSLTLNIKNTPYYWLSDSFLFEAIPSLRKALIRMNHLHKAGEIDKELFDMRTKLSKKDPLYTSERDFEKYWNRQKEVMYSARDSDGNIVSGNMNYFSARLRALSQAEGKWALASLLARAKVAVANVIGGGTNLWAYSGARNIWNARDINLWRDINPNTDESLGPVFRTMEDVWKWSHGLGVVEEMILYEAGLQQSQYKKGNWNAFVSDAASKINKDPQFSDKSLRQLAKNYKISDFVFDKAAWFMRSSERQLRTRSFLSGYLQMRENMQPVEFKLNDPYLIAAGKKAVKATQFYYHAPYRPAFARTSAGKVFNRFKLWTWNSAKFRREVFQEAKYLGYQPDTVEFQRLKRLVQADSFVIALSMLLPYTMFDYSLPAPYSYMQNLADWTFGDEKVRERAYFGVLPHAIAPIHEIMPSILRGPEMFFGSIFTGSWERLANYTLISYVPFGMMARDLAKAYQSPSMLTEFVTGVPLHRLQRAKEDISKGKKAPAYTPGGNWW